MKSLPEILKDIQHDLSEGVKQVEIMIKIIQGEETIDSFERSYCTDCDHSCGRTNAEIYNCIMDKRDSTKQDQKKYTNQQYTKEYLENDLTKVKSVLDICHANITKAIETYET